VVAIFSRNLAAQTVSTINGTGEQKCDYVYVADVARANMRALQEEVPSGTYNMATGKETSVNEHYEMLAEISGKDLAPQHGPARPGEQLRSSVEPSLASRVLGWRPEVCLRDGFQETLRFFGAV
jgi:UDP-glucose 4-epimerase